MDTNIPLAMLGAYLRDHTDGPRPVPHYTRMWQRASAGELQGLVRKDKFSARWTWNEADLPAIAAALGRVMKPQPKSAPRRARAKASVS